MSRVQINNKKPNTYWYRFVNYNFVKNLLDSITTLLGISKLVTINKESENRIRTDDPRITNALLYQLSYPGVIVKIL